MTKNGDTVHPYV